MDCMKHTFLLPKIHARHDKQEMTFFAFMALDQVSISSAAEPSEGEPKKYSYITYIYIQPTIPTIFYLGYYYMATATARAMAYICAIYWQFTTSHMSFIRFLLFFWLARQQKSKQKSSAGSLAPDNAKH